MYQPATTLRGIIELSMTVRNPKVRAEQRKKALDDITFDSLRGYILYSQHDSLRFLLSLACQKGYIISYTDIQATYLESYLREDQHVYMEVPPDMRRLDEKVRNDQGRELVCKVVRGIYALKQSGYAWSQCPKEFLLSTTRKTTWDSESSLASQTFIGRPSLSIVKTSKSCYPLMSTIALFVPQAKKPDFGS